jgi:natural product biosynthesis luciferase-like monooxygenase protein
VVLNRDARVEPPKAHPADTDEYPLTYMQMGMLFHSLYAPGAGVYLQQQVCYLDEELDVAHLEMAWQMLCADHAILRTSFHVDEDDGPLQRVHREVAVPFTEHDLRGMGDAQQAAAIDAYLAEDQAAGFDFTRAPVMRVSLFRLADAAYCMVWSYHHALLDGRSRSIVLDELFAAYDALVCQRPIARQRGQSFRHYVEWQQEQQWLESKPFWQAQLAGISTPTTLVGDAAALDAAEPQRGSTNELELELDRELTASLDRLADENRVTLTTVVQGAWALLLSRYSGEKDVVFGATRACRHSGVAGADSMVGLFVNTLPVRVHLAPDQPLSDWLSALRQLWVDLRDHEQTPLVRILEWNDIPPGTPLFNTTVMFEHQQVEQSLHSRRGAWRQRRFKLHQRTNFPLELAAFGGDRLLLQIRYDEARFEQDHVERMLGHLETLLRSIASDVHQPLGRLTLLSEAEQRQLLVEWNATEATYDRTRCIHHLFEEQVGRTPNKTAIHFGDQQITYAELNRRSNQLAHYLQDRGVRAETLVGIHMERSIDLMVGLLGILKAGGAYVPLDPTYPEKRISFMVEDAAAPVLLTEEQFVEELALHDAQVVCIDRDWSAIASRSSENPTPALSPDNPSYVIYTSGSTGTPKGVVVLHRNVVNFFAGMDDRIRHDPPGVWLAVTSLSFDISVLELFWTLARGFEIVIHADRDIERVAEQDAGRNGHTTIDFSLFYFASAESDDNASDKYRLLIEGAKFADRHGFAAVWTPERHFHRFGGLYPNPAVAGAALAMATEHVQIRAGSCVLPLHNPIRVAEEWAVVDNLSNGRVGLAVASGWQPNDFVLEPNNFVDRKETMFRGIETLRRLWAGEGVTVPGPTGDDIEIRTLPRPVQEEIPIWITAAGSPETYERAGASGYRLLTHLLGQTVDELAEKLAIYRRAWHEAGHAGRGHVTLMLHTYVGDDIDDVRSTVSEPMTEYLRSAVGLIGEAAESLPLLKERAAIAGRSPLQLLESGQLSDEDMGALLAHAFDRYFDTSGLFGTPQSCTAMVARLKDIEVDEIACLIDFGVDSESVLQHLGQLDQLRRLANGSAAVSGASIPQLIERHGVTHLQCTPSLAGTLTLTSESRAALGSLDVLMVGGEQFPSALAEELTSLVGVEVLNMYGPTETTIWSATHVVDDEPGAVPIGRPIANTQLYVVDENLMPVPVGIAGELLIGGDGVVRGYLDRPELTAERFVANPFDPDISPRLYRSGDLVRYRPDGMLEFLGRIDHQVKIRGHRIELGEIEAMLVRHPQVQSAVVVAVASETNRDESYLAAYLISNDQGQPTVASLRQLLLTELPDYMVPSAFMYLDAFPLTPNGKIDRKALPVPTMDRSQLDHAYVAPRSAVERRLSRLWTEVLEVDQVGIHDDFFDLGGHSLQAVRLFAQIRQTMGVNMPLAVLFQAPTIAELSSYLDEGDKAAPASSCLVPIQPAGTNPPLFCVHGGDGNVMIYRALSNHLGPNQPFYGLQALGLVDDQEPHTSVEEMAVHYVHELRRIQEHGPYLLAGNCSGGTIVLEVAQQLYRAGETVALLAVFDTQHWSERDKRSPRDWWYGTWQRGEFFVRNVLHVDHRHRRDYLRQKWELLRSRRRVQRKMADSSYRYNLTDIIHDAVRRYRPSRYPGRVTEFTTRKVFRRFDQSEIRWLDLAEGGVEQVVMPFCPGTMVEEPFVEQLATELTKRIGDAVAASLRA